MAPLPERNEKKISSEGRNEAKRLERRYNVILSLLLFFYFLCLACVYRWEEAVLQALQSPRFDDGIRLGYLVQNMLAGSMQQHFGCLAFR